MVKSYHIYSKYYIYGQFLLHLWLVLHLWFLLHLWVIQFSPIVFDFGELYSIFVASIIGVHVTLSYNVQRMFKLSINTFVCIHVSTSITFPTSFEI